MNREYKSTLKSSINDVSGNKSPSPNDRYHTHARMQSTLAPFESLAENSSQAVLEELFKNKQYNSSTIATTQLPCIGFAKQTSRKSLVNLKENPHESRFKNINRFPSILSSNKKTDSLVSWDQGRNSLPRHKSTASKDWLVNQLAKKKKSYVHKFKKSELQKQNQQHLL